MQQKNRQMIRWRKNKEEGKEGERRTEADEGYVCVCDMYCFSNWKGKLVLFCSGAHRVLRNRKPRDLPILADSWCPPIAVPPSC